jgi:putative transposase
LKEVDAGGKVQDVIRKLGISEQMYYRWKAKYGGMEVSNAKKLRALEDDNRRLKQMVAEQALDMLRRQGWKVNHKRVYRIYRAEGLAVRRKRRKRLAWIHVKLPVPTNSTGKVVRRDRLGGLLGFFYCEAA